jgi:2'-5' RNA ligase
VASPDYSDGCMIALYPPRQLADDLAVADGLDPAEMHVTVAYLGGTAEVDRSTLLKVAQSLAGRGPIEASVSGHARFTGGEQDVVVALVDSPGLEDLRRDTMDLLTAQGVEIPRDHGYTPHLTIQYLAPDADTPLDRLPSVPVAFTAVSAVYGNERTNFPLSPFESAAIRNYGTVESATIQLSSPQGVWRPVYARRMALHATADAIVLAAWRADADGLTLRPALTAWRRTVGELDQQQQQRREAAAAMILAVLTSQAWKRLRAALALAIQRAYAAGWQAGHHLTTADLADDSEYDDTTGSGYTLGASEMPDATAQATATSWLGRILAAVARRAGRAMADTHEDPLAAIAAVLAASLDVTLTVDLAVSAAYGAGLIAAYISAGIQALQWITAGDGAVCQRCDDIAGQGPYSPFAAPALPQHPSCRCILAPA